MKMKAERGQKNTEMNKVRITFFFFSSLFLAKLQVDTPAFYMQTDRPIIKLAYFCDRNKRLNCGTHEILEVPNKVLRETFE